MIIRRGKGRVRNSLVLRDLYVMYLKDNPPGSIYYVTALQFTRICKAAHELMCAKLIKGEAQSLKFPSILGGLTIIKRKITSDTRLRVNWELTKKHNLTIYHENEHSNGFYCKWQWLVHPHRPDHGYKFRILRRHKRALAAAILQDRADLLFLSNIKLPKRPRQLINDLK